MESLDTVTNRTSNLQKNIREHPRFKGHSFEAHENIADVISSHDRYVQMKFFLMCERLVA
jgi:hypothetical protein